MSRSNGARAASMACSMPSATASSSSPGPWPIGTPLIARIVGGDVDRDRVDVGGDALGLWPQRQRGEGEQAGAGADVGDVGEALAGDLEPVERGEAAGGGVMLAGAEGEPGVDLEGDRALGHGVAMGRGVDEEAPGADRLEPGLAHRHPIILAEMLDRRASHPRRAWPARRGRRASARRRNKRGCASRRAAPGRARRRRSPAAIAANGNRSSLSGSASASARVQWSVTRQLISCRFLGQPLVERLASRAAA